MKRNVIIAIVISILVINSGCMSMARKQQMFRDERDYDIGRSFSNIPVPEPTKITPIGKEKIEYLIEYKNTDCKWIFVVDESTRKVESWHYVSDPQNCYLEIDWFGPW